MRTTSSAFVIVEGMFGQKKSHTLVILVLLLGMFILLFATNPNNLPLPLLILPFVLLFLIIFTSTLFVIQRRSSSMKLLTPKSSIIAFTVAGVPVLLAVFQSIHQLSIRDVLISAGLFGGIVFYLSKTDVLTS